MGFFNNKKHEAGENCCPNCGAALEDDSLFCAECGVAVDSGTSAGCGEQKLCPECCTMVDDDSNFCWSCGHVFETLLNRCTECNAILSDDAEVCTMCGTPTGKANPKSALIPESIPSPEPVPIFTSISSVSPTEASTSSISSSMGKVPSERIKEEESRAAERNFHKPSAL